VVLTLVMPCRPVIITGHCAPSAHCMWFKAVGNTLRHVHTAVLLFCGTRSALPRLLRIVVACLAPEHSVWYGVKSHADAGAF
jgi:hypothetical protein